MRSRETIAASALAVLTASMPQTAACGFVSVMERVGDINCAIWEECGTFTLVNGLEGVDIAALIVNSSDAANANTDHWPSWWTKTITKEDWAGGSVFFGPEEWTWPDTTTISWQDDLGFDLDEAFVYFLHDYDAIPSNPNGVGGPVASGEARGAFNWFSGEGPLSSFVAFAEDGGYVTGATTVVPVPATLLLFGSGIGLLGFSLWGKRINAAV